MFVCDSVWFTDCPTPEKELVGVVRFAKLCCMMNKHKYRRKLKLSFLFFPFRAKRTDTMRQKWVSVVKWQAIHSILKRKSSCFYLLFDIEMGRKRRKKWIKHTEIDEFTRTHNNLKLYPFFWIFFAFLSNGLLCPRNQEKTIPFGMCACTLYSTVYTLLILFGLIH